MNQSFRLGTMWAILLLGIAALLMKPGSNWVIDDCIKQIAAKHANGIWAEKIADGPIRSKLETPNRFSPILPPFAERGSDGLVIGFSPLTRFLFKAMVKCGPLLFRVIPVLIVILFWIVLERSGWSFSFLLLPLTFYGLVPWEHALSWLLLWPILRISFRTDNVKPSSWILAGISLSVAMLLRPEIMLLGAVMSVYLLIQRKFRPFALFVISGLIVAVAFLLIHHATASETAWIQISLNDFYTRGSSEILQWVLGRLAACWSFFLSMDESDPISLGMLVVFVAAVVIIYKHERKPNPLVFGTGVILLVLWTAVYEYRLWSHPMPALVLAHSNSLPAALPWIVVLLLPPYKGRTAFLLFGIVTLLVVLSVPIWEGVHWGPRLLLFAVPLLLIDLRSTDRAKGILFRSMLALTAILTLTSALLVYARATEMSDRTERLRPHLGSPVVCTMMYQCTDLAPLWTNREIFRVSTPRELRQLAIQFRDVGVDTFFLHVAAADRALIQSFPAEGPIKPYHMTIVWAGNLYKSVWRVYELPMNSSDTLWADLLQDEAGQLFEEQNHARSLKLQREAVELKPNDAKVHYNLSLILGSLGQETEASKELQISLKLDSSFTLAKELLSKTLPSPESSP